MRLMCDDHGEQQVTTVGGGPRKSGEDRRVEIIETAAELFSRKGYTQTTLIDIARPLGITGPAIYHYFETKDRILYEIREQIIRESLQRVRDIIAEEEDPVAALSRILTDHVQTLLDNVDANVVYEKERGMLPDDTERAIRAQEHEYEQALRDVYAQGVDQDRLAPIDPRLAIGTLLAGCNWSYRVVGRLPKKVIVESLVTVLMRGITISGKSSGPSRQ
jgi:AcrR family transcriptional regulator